MLFVDDECDECEGLNVVNRVVKVEKFPERGIERHWYEYRCRDCFATFKDWKEIETND